MPGFLLPTPTTKDLRPYDRNRIGSCSAEGVKNLTPCKDSLQPVQFLDTLPVNFLHRVCRFFTPQLVK